MVDKVDSVAYQLKGVAQVWFEQFKGERVVSTKRLDWGNLRRSS